MNRGMTLVEVLVSLALLSALSLASLGWTQMTRDLARSVEPIAWNAAADRVMQQISNDLTTGDFSPSDEEELPTAPTTVTATQKRRVSVESGSLLRIRTRSRSESSGEVTREFFRRGDGTLMVRENARERVFVDRVASWRCELRERPSKRPAEVERWLDVSLTADDGGGEESRSFFLGVFRTEDRR